MPKFVHLRTKGNRGGVTIAYSVDEEAKVVYYALARCNPSDNFCRRIGRVKAAGRLLSPKWVKEFKFNEWKEVHEHFLTYRPDNIQVVPDLKDRSFGKSAAHDPWDGYGMCGV